MLDFWIGAVELLKDCKSKSESTPLEYNQDCVKGCG